MKTATILGTSYTSLNLRQQGVSLSLYAVQHANTGVAATLMGLVPIFIILPSVIFFKQKITAVQILGTFVSVGGCVLLFV